MMLVPCPIARFADEGGAQRWIGYLERAAEATG